MNPKSRLGRGIDALFSESIVEGTDQIIEIAIDEIIPSSIQPRSNFDEQRIEELSQSIKVHGVISPILVRRIETKYEIIAGERRYRACLKLGQDRIPAVVRELPDDEAFKISLIENLQREDLNPMEEAEAYYTLKHQFHLTHQDIATAVSKDRSTVTNALRLVVLPEEIKAALRQGSITPGHARAILMLSSPTEQLALLSSIIERHLSVREAERRASDTKQRPHSRRKSPDPFLERLALRLSTQLATQVSLSFGKRKGRIVIEVSSRDEMERLVEELTRDELPL